MKKFVLFLVLLLLPSVIFAEDLRNIPIDKMQAVSLKKIIDIDKLEGYSSFQGFVATDKYFVVIAKRAGEVDQNALYVFDNSTYQLVTLPDNKTNPIIGIDLGHGNDMAFNSRTNEIISTSTGKKLVVLDADTFEIKETKTLNFSFFANTYDYKNDLYYFASGDTAHVVDSNFQDLSTFGIQTNLTRQGFSFYEGNIYYSCYEAGHTTTYEPVYEGILRSNENLIYVMDNTGKLLNTFYIPITDNFAGGEIEGVTFSNGMMYILYNNSRNGTIYVPNYDSVSVSLKVNTDIDDKDKMAILKHDNEEIESVHIDDGSYQFGPISFDKPGVYVYSVLEDNDTIGVTINVSYNPVYNRLDTTISYDKIGFYHEKTEENTDTNNTNTNNSDNVVNSNIKENPKTGILSIIVIFLGSIIAIVIGLCTRKLTKKVN